MRVVGIYLKTGHRISEEIFELVSNEPLDQTREILRKLFSDSTGVKSFGVLVSNYDQNRFMPTYVAGNIQVSPGWAIFPDGLLVEYPGILSAPAPSSDAYIYLKYNIVDDNTLPSHDFKGVLDYPVKIVELEIVFGSYNPSYTDRIVLGFYNSSDNSITLDKREYAIILSGLLWPGDNSNNINGNLDLTPSVEPGTSLWKFLACKGSGERTVNNPFGLTFDDIQGEINYDLQKKVLQNGIVTNPKGIYSNIHSEFNSQRFIPLKADIAVVSGSYYVVFNLNNDGIGNCVSDIYSPDASDPATNQEGIILVNGKWFKYVDNHEFELTGNPFGYYVFYLEDTGVENTLTLSYAQFADLASAESFVDALDPRGSVLPLVIVNYNSAGASIVREYTRDGLLSSDYIIFNASNKRFPDVRFIPNTDIFSSRDTRNINEFLNYYFARRLPGGSRNLEVIGLGYYFASNMVWNDIEGDYIVWGRPWVAIESNKIEMNFVDNDFDIYISDSGISIGTYFTKMFRIYYDKTNDRHIVTRGYSGGFAFQGDGWVVYGFSEYDSVDDIYTKGKKNRFVSNVQVRANLNGLPWGTNSVIGSENTLLNNYTLGGKETFNIKWKKIDNDKYYLAAILRSSTGSAYLYLYYIDYSGGSASFVLLDSFGVQSLIVPSDLNQHDFDIYAVDENNVLVFVDGASNIQLRHYNYDGSSWNLVRSVDLLSSTDNVAPMYGTGFKIFKLSDEIYRIFYVYLAITNVGPPRQFDDIYIVVGDYNINDGSYTLVLNQSHNIGSGVSLSKFGSNLIYDGVNLKNLVVVSYNDGTDRTRPILFTVNDILGASPYLSINLFDVKNVIPANLTQGILPFNKIKPTRRYLYFFDDGESIKFYYYPINIIENQNYVTYLIRSGVDYEERKNYNDIRFLVPSGGWGVIFPTDIANFPHFIGIKVWPFGDFVSDIVYDKYDNVYVRGIVFYNNGSDLAYREYTIDLEWDE